MAKDSSYFPVYGRLRAKDVNLIKPSFLYLILGAISISFAPIFVKLSQLSAGSIGFYRNIFGFLAIFLYACYQQKRAPRISKNQMGLALLGGFIFCLDLYFWHLSIKIIGAGLATVLANTQIFFAALISHFYFKEKIPGHFLVWAVTAIVGLFLLCVPDFSVQPELDYIKGIFLAIAAGSLYASFMSCIKIWNQKYSDSPQYYPILWISLGTAISFALIDSFQIERLNEIELLWMLLLGVLVHAGGWLFINKAIQLLKFSSVSLGLLLQPVLASLIAFFLFQEKLVYSQLLGMGVCLYSIYKAQRLLAKK
jgi:drug/metabolite transporter (DMT)-like permease